MCRLDASDLFLKLEFETLLKKFNIVFDPSKRHIESSKIEPANFKKPFAIGVLDDITNEDVAIYRDDDKLYLYTEKYSFYYDGYDIEGFLKRNRIICHHFKSWAKDYDFDCAFDVMLAGYIVSPSDSSYELNSLCIKHLGIEFSAEYGARLIYELYKALAKGAWIS